MLSDSQISVQSDIIQYGLTNGFSTEQIQIAVDVAMIESSLGVNLQNTETTASGIFQYVDGNWNIHHSGIGGKDDTDNQIQAFFSDLEVFSSWYSNPSTNGNIPDDMSLAEYVYVKHHDGRSYSDFGNSEGLVNYAQNSGQVSISDYSSAFELAQDNISTWFESNTNNDFGWDDSGGSPVLVLNPGISEDSLLDVVATLITLQSVLTEFIAEHEDELSASEKADLEQTAQDAAALAQGAALAYYDPLVLDLDGDGVETVSFTESTASFDLFGTGEMMFDHGWISQDDGLLAIDSNGNGLVDDISELFGDRNTSGFEELSELDSNSDGVFDANDEQFSDVFVWRDLSQDGVSQDNEMFSLGEIGIVSIDLAASAEISFNSDNVITETSTFEFSDGSIGVVADVGFTVDFTSSEFEFA